MQHYYYDETGDDAFITVLYDLDISECDAYIKSYALCECDSILHLSYNGLAVNRQIAKHVRLWRLCQLIADKEGNDENAVDWYDRATETHNGLTEKDLQARLDELENAADLNADRLRELTLEMLHDLPTLTGERIDQLTDLCIRIEKAYDGDIREWTSKAKANLLSARSHFGHEQTLDNLMDTGRHDEIAAAIAFGISCAYRAACIDSDEWDIPAGHRQL